MVVADLPRQWPKFYRPEAQWPDFNNQVAGSAFPHIANTMGT
jgi:hypothetical protein